MVNNFLQFVGHDAFRYGGGLNKSAAEVYWFLTKESMTANELVKISGRSRRTVFRVLSLMSKLIDSTTGEVISMVGKDGLKWQALDVDLNRIAQIVGTAGKGKHQQKQYKDEREAHRKALKLGRSLKTKDPSD